MIHFERGDWLGQVFAFHGTIVESLWWPTLLYFFYCTAMFLLGAAMEERYDKDKLVVDDHGSVRFLGGFVSFLLIFQLNESYGRFTHGITLTADFFSHLYGALAVVFAYMRREAADNPPFLASALIGDPARRSLGRTGLPGLPPDAPEWQLRERMALEAIAAEVHVLRLILAIGVSLRFHVRIAEHVLSGGQLPLETVQLLLFDLHRVRGLLLPNEQAIVDQACGLYLEDKEVPSRGGKMECNFRVRLHYHRERPAPPAEGERRLRRLVSGMENTFQPESTFHLESDFRPGSAGMALPLLLVQLLRRHLAKVMLAQWGFRERVANVVEHNLEGVCKSFECLERLITLPFPLAYLQHSKLLFLMFTAVYPLCLGTDLGFWANCISPSLIFFALLGFEVLADELENPLGTGPTDLNIMEMVHALEVRAFKAFEVAETLREALREDEKSFLEELGVPPALPHPVPASTRERLQRSRRFSQHFCWVRLPEHVLRDVGRQDVGLPQDLSTPRKLETSLHTFYDGGRRLRRFICRRRQAHCADYGELGGEDNSGAAQGGFWGGVVGSWWGKDSNAAWQDFLGDCMTHFVCLRSQESAMRSICDEMEGCVDEEPIARADTVLDEPSVEVRLASRLTGAVAALAEGSGLAADAAHFPTLARAMTGFGTAQMPTSPWQTMPPKVEEEPCLLSASRSSSGALSPGPKEQLPTKRRKYTAHSAQLAEFAKHFAPRASNELGGERESAREPGEIPEEEIDPSSGRFESDDLDHLQEDSSGSGDGGGTWEELEKPGGRRRSC